MEISKENWKGLYVIYASILAEQFIVINRIGKGSN